MSRLVLCSGPLITGHKADGWVTLDAGPQYKPDIEAIIPPLPWEVRNGSWQKVMLIHGIEHLG